MMRAETRREAALIHKRICRLNATSRSLAMLYVDEYGGWEVISGDSERDRIRCGKYEDRGWFVGAYSDDVSLSQIVEDVRQHIADVREYVVQSWTDATRLHRGVDKRIARIRTPGPPCWRFD